MISVRCVAGLVALIVNLVAAAGVHAADVQTRLEQLNQREKQLLEKLQAVQERERDIQSRIEEVRRRKQYLLNQRTVRDLRKPEETAAPAPTP